MHGEKPEVLTNGILLDEGRGEAIIFEAQELYIHCL
jgi:hypothetical protein